jgi:probable selenium-dependent hydroxylase accessory protein YqeC
MAKMNLPTPFLDAFRIQAGDTVAIAGSGGKATLMYHLASEAVSRSHTVITSSTTHLHPPTSLQTNGLYITEEIADWLQMMPGELDQYQHVTVLESRPRPDKLRGLSLENLNLLRQACRPDLCLVKADGARTRLFKAPGDHEPVVPEWTTHGLVVVSLQAVGLPLSEKHVHRPDRVADLTGLTLNDPITIPAIAKVVSHPNTYFRAFPTTTPIFLYISCSADEPQIAQAHAISNLIPAGTFTGVFCGDINRSQVVITTLREWR